MISSRPAALFFSSILWLGHTLVPRMVVVLDFGEDRSKFKAFDYTYTLDVTNCRELTLEAIDVPDTIPSTAPSRLSVSSRIHTTEHSTVFRVTDGEQLFVVKFALWSGIPTDDLETEVGNYNKLSHIQGTVIPKFFGHYRAEKEEMFKKDKTRVISCIILEDCGNSIPLGRWSYLDKQATYLVFDLLEKIHLEGHVHPNNFEPRNVVHRDGVYRIIDLHDLSPHECAFDGTYFAADGGPLFSLICPTIEHLAWEANYWCQSESQKKADAEEEDTWVRIGGARFPEEYMPPQDVVDQIVPPCINYFCATLRMFNDRFFRFFFGVRNEHALTVEEDSSLVGIPAEECPYTEDEIEAFKEWWKDCELPTTTDEVMQQIEEFRYKKAEI